MAKPISRAPALSAGTGSAMGVTESFITDPFSHAHIAVLHVGSMREFRRRSAPDDPAALDEIMPVGDASERVDVLVDYQEGQTRAFEPLKAAPDFDADQGRESFCRLVEDEQARIGHECAADRQHLLLAAGELAAHALTALGKARKQRVDL